MVRAEGLQGAEQEAVVWKPELDAMVTKVRVVERDEQRKKAAAHNLKEELGLLHAVLMSPTRVQCRTW